MTGKRICILLALAAALLMACQVLAADPIKWSAPLNYYPRRWTPTQPPPSWNNPYGYNYPYARFGYGPYWGGGYYQGGYPQAYPQAFRQGYGYQYGYGPNYGFYYGH